MRCEVTKTLTRLVIALALVLAAWRLGQAQTAIAEFRVTVVATTGGARMECLRGCAWKTLSFKCEGKTECKAEVDERGVGVLGDPGGN
jgi:hypothetical protein